MNAVETFQDVGYMLLEHVISSELHDQIMQFIHRTMLEIGEENRVKLATFYQAPDRMDDLYVELINHHPNLVRTLNTALTREDGFIHQKLFTHPLILSTVRSLLANDRIVLTSRRNVRAKIPQKRVENKQGIDFVPWHQDHGSDNSGTTNFLTVFVAIASATKDNGCLEILPGSHKKIIEHVYSDGYGKYARPDIVDDSGEIFLEMNQGDAAFFHGLCMHKSDYNRSNSLRWSSDFRFQRANEASIDKKPALPL